MADEPEDDILELTQEIEEAEPADPQDDDLSLEIEGEETGDETPVVRQLRQRLRDSERELHETRKANALPPADPGPEPDLWDDCEGNPEKYKEALRKWDAANSALAEADKRTKEQAQSKNQALERAVIKYKADAATIKVKGFAEAEKAVLAALGPEYLGAIAQYADEPVKLVGALGNNPGALARVAAEPDGLRQMKMLFDLEKKIVAKRTAPPPPETDTIQRGTAAVSRGSVDKRAEKLLEAATRGGGSMDEYRAYMKSKK